VWTVAHRATTARSGSILRTDVHGEEEGYHARLIDWLETVRVQLARLREEAP